LLALCGCVSVPLIALPQDTQSGTEIQLRGARGRLSQRQTNALLKQLAAQMPDASALQRHLVIEQQLAGSPLYTGNGVTILRDGPATFAAMAALIANAQHYLYLEYYTLEDVNLGGEPLEQLLLARHAQGVSVDVLYDSVGSLSTPSAFFDHLRDAGIAVREFNPVNPLSPHFALNERDHRKILLADGQLAILGGVNMSTSYESGSSEASGSSGTSGGSAASDGGALGEAPAQLSRDTWHDTDLRIDGPAVRELQRLFEQHWLDQGGVPAELALDAPSALPHGDQVVRIVGSYGGQIKPRYYGTLLSAIRSAQSRIWVNAAYFVPTHQEKEALERAARRGADVRLLLPSRSDSGPSLAVQHSHYSDLLRAGVRIYERDDGILHSKTVVLDGVWSIVGSSNFDHRSVLFNDEVDAVVIGNDTGQQLEHNFQQDLQHALPVDLAIWKRRPLLQKLREQFWKLWQPLL
jgi:cardiolipin synthase